MALHLHSSCCHCCFTFLVNPLTDICLVQEKIKKLIDIWERGYTFPAAMLNSFREKLNAPPQSKFIQSFSLSILF